jgi:capsular exopolysaccharide synthesis family protein
MSEPAFSDDDWSSPVEETPAPRRRDSSSGSLSDLSKGPRSGRAGPARDEWRHSGPPPRHPRDGGADLPALPLERPPALRRDYPVDAYASSPGYGEPPRDEFRFDIRKYLWLVFKHRWLILGTVGAFLCLGVVITFLTTPIYRASTTVQISRQAAKIVEGQDVVATDSGRDTEFYQTQYELLKSRSLAERVVAKTNLQDDPLFMKSEARSPWTALRNAILGGAKKGSTSSAADAAARQKAAAFKVLDGLTIAPVRISSIVKISFDSPNPQLAKKVADAIADSFIAANLDRGFESSSYARKFLEERLQQLKVKLEESEKDLVAYAEQQQIVVAGSDNQNLTMSNLTAANDALTKATSERMRAELMYQQIQSADGIGIPQILENDAIKKMREKRSDLAADYQDKLSFFKPAFPEMKKLKAQIDELDKQLSDEIELIKQSVKAQYDAAVAEEKSLVERINQEKAAVTDFRNRNIRYTILQREVDTNRSLYEGLLQRYKEIGIAGGVGTNNVSIVDRAEVPGAPFTPKLSRNLALAMVLGLLFGGAAAFAREQIDDTFRSPEDIEEHLGVPLLGIIPLAKDFDDVKKSLADPRSHVAEAYRSLRTALQFSTASGVPSTLLITSSRPSEGKSTTAIMLARNFAELGMKVLLIDSDLRKPALHRYMGIDDGVGLTNYLAGSARPPDVFHSTDLPGLTFMACGPLPPNPAELLAGPKMLSLLTIGAEKFDLVVVDGPPVVGLADAPLLASIAGGTLLVIDASNTRRSVAKAALKRLNFARAQMLGAVINKLNTTKAGYTYGYGYGYGEGYGGEGYYGVTEEQTERLTDARQNARQSR